MDKVSIIIPVYNRENTIIKSIRSVLNQTYKNIEIIVVDDGSTDLTREVLKKYIDNKKIFYFYKNNSGVSDARNLGIEKSTGNYITFLDSDDEYLPTFISKMVSEIKLKTADICYTGHYFVKGGEREKVKIRFSSKNLFLNYLKNKTTPHTNSWMIKKLFLSENQLKFESNNNFGEDMLFFSQLLCKEPKVSFVDDYLTLYHLDTPKSLSKEIKNKIIQDKYWTTHVIEDIAKSNFSKSEKNKLIRVITGYRLPASIIYCINSSEDTFDKRKILEENRKILKKIRIVNGLRSIKAIYILFKLNLK